MSYQPGLFRPLSFHDARQGFLNGSDDPRAYLERCLQVISEKEPAVLGWVVLNEEAARKAADESTARYRSGRPLSLIDGMPLGVKDLIETKDMPTQMGSPLFEGNFPKRDSAVIRALRNAGAVVLGKTVTTPMGLPDPGPTNNPFDLRRTPGGSSSGSGAVVGAGMVPVALGTQLVGSMIRPASFCANWALKPTFGAINRGERLGFSQSHIGVHAGTAQDMWLTAIEMVQRSGGDPGHPGLYGTLEVPAPRKPGALAVLETEGWTRLDEASRAAFEQSLDTLAAQGVRIVRRKHHTDLDVLEQGLSDASAFSMRLISWEQHWSLENLVEQFPQLLSPSLVKQLESGRAMTLDHYRGMLEQREALRRRYASVLGECDALISLSACGPAPLSEEVRKTPYPTGDYSFSCVSSLLGGPAVSAPILAVDGMPLGLQLLGQWHADAQTTAIARWLYDTLVDRP